MESLWTAIAAVSSAVSALAVLITIAYATRQIREMQAARTVETFMNVFDAYQDTDLNTVRRKLKSSGLEALDETERERLRVEFLGILVDRRFVPM